MTTRDELLEHARTILCRGDAVSLDAVAREAGLTKPGVIHHVGSKEGLMIALVDHVIDHLEDDWGTGLPAGATVEDRLTVYLDYALDTPFDGAELAALADPRLRDALLQRWAERFEEWFVFDTDPTRRAAQIVVRQIADGVWYNRALGILEPDEADREAIRATGHGLLRAAVGA